MRLVIAMIQDQDVNKLLGALTEHGYSATKLASTGGFLRQGNTTLLIGLENEKVPEVIQLIKETCHSRKQLVTPLTTVGGSMNNYMPSPIETSLGGATIFVLDVVDFIKV
ncbi:MAG: cyclic-di-AMP receptor [Firmicutes bacterium]|nr:cyclic-di-AMP receptor [Bacillota bacterium]